MPVIHPAFIHFPIALVVISFVCDFFGKVSRSSSLRSAGWWTLCAAAVFGVAAVGSGLWDMYHVPIADNADRFVSFHMWIGFAILGAAAVLTVWRGFIYTRRQTTNIPYLMAMFVAAVLILFQGWVGGEMVYSYGVGVAPAGQSLESPAVAQKRLEKVESVFGPFDVSTKPAPKNETPMPDDERNVR